MVGDLIMRALYGSPIQEAYGGGGGPFPPGGIVGAMTGGAAAGGPPQTQQMPPAQATQSPPDMAKANSALASNPNIVQLYLRQEQLNRAADQFDRGLEGLVLSKTPPSMQSGVIASMSPQPRTDAGTELQTLMDLQMRQQMMGFMNGSGGGGGLALLAQQSGIPLNVLQMGMYTDPKGTMERVNEAIKVRQGVPGQIVTQQKQAGDIEEFKNSGIQDFSTANQKLTENESRVDQLLKDLPSTMTALKTPDILTTSKLAASLPGFISPSDVTKQQAIAIEKLEAELTGSGLSEVKNVRNQREFGTLGEALIAGLNANNGPEGVRQALLDIKNKFATTHAQAYAVAGKQIPVELAGLADQTYLDKNSPYYTGATEAGTPMSDETRAAAEAVLAKDPTQREALMEHLRQQGINPRGL